MSDASCFHDLKEGGIERQLAPVLDIFAPPREEYRRLAPKAG